MKLRNKKTGKIVECECITIFEPIYDKVLGKSVDEFYTLAELNENWEDYEPKEPLIKDEKIKKLFAEITELELVVNEFNNRFNEFNKHYIELCEEDKE